MANKAINELPVSSGLDDNALLPVWQNGQTQSIKGQLVRQFAETATEEAVERAEQAAQTAEESVEQIGDSVQQTEQNAQEAQAARDAIVNMTVQAQTLASGQPATVTKTLVEGIVNLLFGLPRGEQGIQGDTGATGPTGAAGKSAYQYAVESGYTGTEADLSDALASLGDLNSILDNINGEII